MKKRLIYNTTSALLYQLAVAVSGLILPRLILSCYGSEVNGLVNSITSFLRVIVLMEFGVGAVVQSAFYKPLVEKNSTEISKIVASATKFFNLLGKILLIYVAVLMLVYPLVVKSEFKYTYISSLIVIVSFSSFANYFWGKVDQLLLTADQRGYVQNLVMTLVVTLSAIVNVILMLNGMSIHTVKLAAALIYLAIPVSLRIYVNNHYTLNRKINYTIEPIQQKKNGVAQHIAAYILDGTDVIVLTALSTLANVSIYTVYNLVIQELRQIISTLTGGIQAVLGELWARQEFERLNRIFSIIEWVMHNAVIFLFGCTSVLIVPFVSVYTKGITDADYYAPLFAFLLTVAHLTYCLGLPRLIMVLAANQYRQTQNYFIIAATINVVISVGAVHFWGLIGVAFGTLIAMIYQVSWLVWYTNKNLIPCSVGKILRQFAADILIFAVAYFVTSRLPFSGENYIVWMFLGIKVAIIWFITAFIINLLFYRKNLFNIFQMSKSYILKKKTNNI